MGNWILTLRSKHGNIVLDDASTEKIKESPQEAAEQKTGKKRYVKIILTRKQLELLLLKSSEGVSFKLPETYGGCNRKWKPSLQTIVEFKQSLCFGTLIISLFIYPSPELDQQVMEVQARLMEYKYHFMVAITVSVLVSSLIYAAPIVLDILSYFWPLFASTAAFLAIAITFGGFQQLSDEATGEGIMDYVAGRPDDSHKYY
ncbi:unnamed protein product [Eruca vesicaria subsp. sativa]|uniref:Uncharacterized protein n=1 Tax=Eruca vesicaria subsp. sativa TaxID=29727 RepID=A0ABC8J7R3_ERUVS|nr:unnamed protein product [Eruca vesicaria subsp. sativa]